MEQSLYGFIGYRNVTFITTRWESSYSLLYFLENRLKTDFLLCMKEHRRSILIQHLKLYDFFKEKTEFIPARLNSQYKAWNYKKRRTKRLNRVHTGNEKPEKQVHFVKSHGKNHENFKKLAKAMKVVMKIKIIISLVFKFILKKLYFFLLSSFLLFL